MENLENKDKEASMAEHRREIERFYTNTKATNDRLIGVANKLLLKFEEHIENLNFKSLTPNQLASILGKLNLILKMSSETNLELLGCRDLIEHLDLANKKQS